MIGGAQVTRIIYGQWPYYACYGWTLSQMTYRGCPTLTMRERECRRRRRERAAERRRAEMEWVCGGPLADIAKPIIGGDDVNHPLIVQQEIQRRTEQWTHEAYLLARHFVKGCLLPVREQARMVIAYNRMIERAGPPGLRATHSTRAGVTPSTIPMVPS